MCMVSRELQRGPVVRGNQVGAGLAAAERFDDGGVAFVAGVVQCSPACRIRLAN
jgi:hypothetical protein